MVQVFSWSQDWTFKHYIQSLSIFTYDDISFPFCLTVTELIKLVGDQGVDSVPMPQDPDPDADDDDMGVVDERLGLVHSAVNLARVPGTSRT